MSLLVENRRELKKHVGAVHTHGKLTLLQRKVANILILNAYNELPTKDEYQIRIRDLAEIAGFDSKNIKVLKDSLRGLMRIVIEWNVLDEAGKEEWGASPMLAQAVIKKGSSHFTYSISPVLRRRLYSPEIYARINLSIQRRFRSGYALALYENCVRFRNVGTTGWIDLETWRKLLGVEAEQYAAFKSFSQWVLKPAIKEVSKHSDIKVTVEYRRRKRRVVAMRFKILDNPAFDGIDRNALPIAQKKKKGNGSATLDMFQQSNPLARRLGTFGLSAVQVKSVLDEHDESYVKEKLDFVESELKSGRLIRNVPGFTLKALEKDYRPRQGNVSVGKKIKEGDGRAALDAKRMKRAEERSQRLEALYAGLSEWERSRVDERVIARLREEIGGVAWNAYRRASEAGEGEDQMPVIVRGTLRSLRLEVVEQMETAV